MDGLVTELHNRSMHHQATNDRLVHLAIKDHGSPYAYSRAMKGSFGCVNAIALSKGAANFIAFGGDDCRVLIKRSFGKIPTAREQQRIFRGHLSNIFSIEFDYSCRMLYSCGNDGYLVQYDIESEYALRKTIISPGIGDINLNHENAVTKLSINPSSENIILTSSLDGTIQRWDSRSRSHAGTLEMQTPQNCVQFNPITPHIFVTSDQRGGLFLFDDRKSFGADHAPLKTYCTKLLKGKVKGRVVDIPSAVWSPDGKKIGAILNGFYPTIYDLDNKNPMFFLSSSVQGNHGYKSISTLKTGCFNSTGTLFGSGSDDFRGYVWRLPSLDETNETFDTSHGISYGDSDEVCKSVPEPLFTLKSHRSIVNSILFHPHLPLIYTAGVEKLVRVFSPFPFSNPRILSSTQERDRGTRVGSHEAGNQSEDSSILNFFDMLTEADGSLDIFSDSEDS